MNVPDYLEILRHITNNEASFVLFENGTAVFLAKCDGDLASTATEILREHGALEIGGAPGAFNVLNLGDDIGWGVTFEHPDLLTLVLPSEIGVKPTDLMVGLMGRGKCGDDAVQLKIAHIEDRRARENI
jgi:hypothetical protein